MIINVIEDLNLDVNSIMQNASNKGDTYITEKYFNTLSYLIELSVSWCLDKKPILSELKEQHKTPTQEDVYESVSYYFCG